MTRFIALQATRDPTVASELIRLVKLPIVKLRLRYRELFRSDPPKAFGPDLLRRSIAQRIQEKAYGGLPRPVHRQLILLIKAYTAKPSGRLVLPPRIKPGSVLVRNWKGNSYRVTVTADGFAYDGKPYSNLSEIASLVAGTRWNGPRFFGLRVKKDKIAEPPMRKPSLGGGSDYRKRKLVHKIKNTRQPDHEYGH